MNCEKGTNAVVVGHPETLGRIVVCVEHYVSGITGEDSWFTNPLPAEGFGYYDRQLRPLRDTDGEDETLSWAVVPKPLASPVPKETTCPL